MKDKITPEDWNALLKSKAEIENQNRVLEEAVESWEAAFERFGLEPDTAMKRVEEIEAALSRGTALHDSWERQVKNQHNIVWSAVDAGKTRQLVHCKNELGAAIHIPANDQDEGSLEAEKRP